MEELFRSIKRRDMERGWVKNHMTKRKFKLGDKVVSKYRENGIVGEIVELSTFRPDGKKPSDFKKGLYGSFTYGVVGPNKTGVTYHFEESLDIAP